MISLASFGSLFSALNNRKEHLFRSWLFEPGMGYHDWQFWWPSPRGKRPRPHEGIDFFCYKDQLGRLHNLDTSLVPAPCGGTVVALCGDFLGQSVFLLPEQPGDRDGLYVLAHISPHVGPGERVQQGDVVGSVAAARGVIPPHLHVSFLQGRWGDLPVELSWPALIKQRQLRFVRPFLE
ncbi:MAG: M23 family metallopeptidase [Desulfurivibrionaceae bacterium]|nr:M23 family metallopeptidase [Desulfurivibrionaceae bacterium]